MALHAAREQIPVVNQRRVREKGAAELNQGWRFIVRNFTPSWFSASMGTGIVSILIHKLPCNSLWIYYLSVVFFVSNISLFVAFTVLSVIRYLFYPNLWGLMLRYPSESLYLGMFPMGFATIIIMFVFVCVPIWKPWAIVLVWIMWIVDAAVAIFTCVYVPFCLMDAPIMQLETITATLLLPVISTVVASAAGGVVAEVLTNPDHALWTLITSYVLLGVGLPLAMAILVIYFYRLIVYSFPSPKDIVSVFLPLGPLGQGGFAAMQLGKVALQLFPKRSMLLGQSSGEALYNFGFAAALIMWGYGLVWLFFAVASLSRAKFPFNSPFNLGWWGFIFPLGAFSIATSAFGANLPSLFFRILGTTISVVVFISWFIVATATLKMALTGDMFVAPCLANIPEAGDNDSQD